MTISDPPKLDSVRVDLSTVSDRQDLITRVEKAFQSLQALGVRLPPGGRFSLHAKELKRILDVATFDLRDDEPVLVQALLDLDVLIEGTEAFANISPDDAFHQLMKKVLGGTSRVLKNPFPRHRSEV